MNYIRAGISGVLLAVLLVAAVVTVILAVVGLPIALAENVGKGAGWACVGVYVVVWIIVAAYDLGKEKLNS